MAATYGIITNTNLNTDTASGHEVSDANLTEIAFHTLYQGNRIEAAPQQRSSARQGADLAALQSCLSDPSSAEFKAQAALIVAEYDQKIAVCLATIQRLNGTHWQDPNSPLHQSANPAQLAEHTQLMQERDAAQIQLQGLISTVKKHVGSETSATQTLLSTLQTEQRTLGGTHFHDKTSLLHIAYTAWQKASSHSEEASTLRERYVTLNTQHEELKSKIALVTRILSAPPAEVDTIHSETVAAIHAKMDALRMAEARAKADQIDTAGCGCYLS